MNKKSLSLRRCILRSLEGFFSSGIKQAAADVHEDVELQIVAVSMAVRTLRQIEVVLSMFIKQRLDGDAELFLQQSAALSTTEVSSVLMQKDCGTL